MHRNAGGGLRRLLVLVAAAAATTALLPATAAAPAAKPKLSDKTLYQILYVEPNHYLQSLGNVRFGCAACTAPPSRREGSRRPASPACRLMPHPSLTVQISDIQGSLSRTFLSPAHRRAAGRLRRWMAAAGMRTWADQMANVHGIVKAAGGRGWDGVARWLQHPRCRGLHPLSPRCACRSRVPWRTTPGCCLLACFQAHGLVCINCFLSS